MIEAESEEPITARGRATRDRILSCAAELMLSEGFSSLSIDRVRKAASVSGSQMTHYFVDKDSLIRAVIRRQTQALLDFHRQPALRDLDTLEDFERWVDLTLRFGRRKTPAAAAVPTYGTLVGALGKDDEKTYELLADGYRQWAELLTAGLVRMKDHGVLTADADPVQLAAVLISAHQGGNMLLSLAYGRPWPDRDALVFALSYLRMFAVDPNERLHPSPETGLRAVRPRRTN
jgi:AcrR family transcriptional regulator